LERGQRRGRGGGTRGGTTERGGWREWREGEEGTMGGGRGEEGEYKFMTPTNQISPDWVEEQRRITTELRRRRDIGEACTGSEGKGKGEEGGNMFTPVRMEEERLWNEHVLFKTS
jgi:hypothetical protein